MKKTDDSPISTTIAISLANIWIIRQENQTGGEWPLDRRAYGTGATIAMLTSCRMMMAEYIITTFAIHE